MTKELSPIKLSTVVESSETIDIMSTFVINEESGASVLYNTKFSQNKIDELTRELLQDFQYALDKELDIFNNDAGLRQYTLLLIVKYFSHFKNEIGATFEEKIVAMDSLYNIGLTNLFFDEIFSVEEVLKVFNHVDKVVVNLTNAIEEDTKAIIEDAKDNKPKRKPRAKKDKPDTTLN